MFAVGRREEIARVFLLELFWKIFRLDPTLHPENEIHRKRDSPLAASCRRDIAGHYFLGGCFGKSEEVPIKIKTVRRQISPASFFRSTQFLSPHFQGSKMISRGVVYSQIEF